jgi:hypothetical protein
VTGREAKYAARVIRFAEDKAWDALVPGGRDLRQALRRCLPAEIPSAQTVLGRTQPALPLRPPAESDAFDGAGRARSLSRAGCAVPHGPGANPSSVSPFDLYWPVRFVPER